MATDTGKLLGERAIVIGAGMGGMMAAGVLAKFFAEVVVLDKEKLPASPEVRNGVPQGAHVHGLLVLGRGNLEKIFPGFTTDLIGRGAHVSRFGLGFRFRDGLGWHPERDLELDFIGVSRPLLEHTVRANLERLRNITIRDGAAVAGWREGADKITVTLAGGTEESLDADLVVDATGRSGQALEMLEANGYGPVEEVVINTGQNYTSAIFEKPAGWSHPLNGCVISSDAPVSDGGVLFSIENNCWMVSLLGRFEHAAPNDLAGFMGYAGNISDPVIHEILSQAKQLTPIRTYRPHLSKWRRYDKLARFPDRLLPLGDAITMFNPMFGQGMTAASFHALCLRDVLSARAQGARALTGVAKEYLQQTHTISEEVWQGLDPLEFSFPKTIGARPADIEQRQAFGLGLRKLIETDAEVHRLFMAVGNLIKPASALGREDIVARVNAIMAQG